MLYYICSPYRGATKEEVEKHIKYARKLTRTVLLHGHIKGCVTGTARCILNIMIIAKVR